VGSWHSHTVHRICRGPLLVSYRHLSERIAFAHVISGCPHRVNDVIGDTRASDVAECAGKPPRDRRVPAFQQYGEYVGRVPDHGETRAGVGRILPIEAGTASDQRGRQGEKPQLTEHAHVLVVRQRIADIKKRRIVRQRRWLVAAPGRVDEKLLRHRAVADVQRCRLLGREAPRRPEAVVQISRAEIPERRVPGRAFPSALVVAGGDVPALHDLKEEAPFQEAFAVRARQITGPDRDAQRAVPRPCRVSGDVDAFRILVIHLRAAGHDSGLVAWFSLGGLNMRDEARARA